MPLRDPLVFGSSVDSQGWKSVHRLSSAFLSSAGIERHFSEAGMLLTEERKRMLPKVTKKLVYIRYEKKYRKWMERLGVSVRWGGVEEGNWRCWSWWIWSWCTGRRPGWVKWLWLLFDWCDFHFSEFLFNMENWKTLLLLSAVTHAPFHAPVLRPTSWPNARDRRDGELS